MRGIFRRGLRLELVAAVGIALAMPVTALAAENEQGLATQTTLNAEARDQNGHTQATVSVLGNDGLPATGAVAILDHGKQLSSAVLNAEGRANIVLGLNSGNHNLRAVYVGDATHQSSTSAVAAVAAPITGTPSFQVAVANLVPLSTPPNTLVAGQSGTAIVTVTASNNASLTAPMFVTLSCSGLPDQSSCTFTPETVEILATTTTLSSSVVIGTQTASSASAKPVAPHGSNPVSWALVLPGGLGLIGLAWGGRRRRWLSHLSLMGLIGLVAMLGTTGCNPRYNYLNHGPTINPATPSGSYNVTITGQSSNGITAITQNATLALTVQ